MTSTQGQMKCVIAKIPKCFGKRGCEYSIPFSLVELKQAVYSIYKKNVYEKYKNTE